MVAFEAHHVAGRYREIKRSHRSANRKADKAAARASLPRKIAGVLYKVSEEIRGIKDKRRLAKFLDRWNVLSHELFSSEKRQYLIEVAIDRMIEARDIVIGTAGDFWMASQLSAQTLFDELAANVTDGVSSFKRQAVAWQRERDDAWGSHLAASA